MKRPHTCGELTDKDVNKKVTLCGWCSTRRDHGGVIFIDLRDRYGITQIVFDPSNNIESHKAAESLRREDVLIVEGSVRNRPQGMANDRMHTGEIEILVNKINSTNRAQTPPIEVEDRIEASEETRLKYRYLDLRRPKMQKQLMFRHQLAAAVREYLNEQGFMEIETPILVKTTPEGARDYLVPSRIHPGKFYSLPQSPQIYKQILMIAGYDKYYQFARCLRDEDARADRSPGEHHQLDIEMSFVTPEDIFAVVESVLYGVFTKFSTWKVDATPFKRIPYAEAMVKYGSDKPDLRIPIEIVDISELFRTSKFNAFRSIVEK